MKGTQQLVASIDCTGNRRRRVAAFAIDSDDTDGGVADADGGRDGSTSARPSAKGQAAAAHAAVRRVTALVPIALLAIVGVIPAFALPAERSTQPLTQRLLAANEIPGYTPVRPTVKLLGLDALAAVTGRTPKQLARAGFLAAAVENLRGPTPIPDKRFISQSSLIRFRSASQARAFLTTLIREHRSTPPGVRRSNFTLPGIPGAQGTRLTQTGSQERLDEYDVIFVAGPFEYEVNVFTPNRVPSQSSFVAAVRHYYHRLPRR